MRIVRPRFRGRGPMLARYPRNERLTPSQVCLAQSVSYLRQCRVRHKARRPLDLGFDLLPSTVLLLRTDMAGYSECFRCTERASTMLMESEHKVRHLAPPLGAAPSFHRKYGYPNKESRTVFPEPSR